MQGQSDFRLPLTAALNLNRRRWAGPLSPAECNAARANGVALAFDPAQGGWVLAEAPDGQDDPSNPLRAALAQVSAPVKLRLWTPEDLPVYHALLDDPELWRYMPEAMPTPFTRETAADLIAISGAASYHQVHCIEGTQGPAGQVRLVWHAPDLGPDEAEISYWLGSAHRGKGLAQAAVRKAGAAAFAARPGLRRILAFVHPDNAASARLLMQAGYTPAGSRKPDGWQAYCRSR